MESVKKAVKRSVCVGVDLGQANDPSAYCLTEVVRDPGEPHTLYIVHEIQRLPLGMSYPDQARRLTSIYQHAVAIVADQHVKAKGIRRFLRVPEMDPPPEIEAAESVWMHVDSTGIGRAVVDTLREAAGIPASHLMAITITGGAGHDLHQGAQMGTTSKEHLISRLSALSGFQRILLPHTEEAKIAASELRDFQFKVADNATITYAARVGAHDDLVISLALSVVLDEARVESGVLRFGETLRAHYEPNRG